MTKAPRLFLLPFLAMFLLVSCKSNGQGSMKNKSTSVQVKVTETRHYCGGAAPSEDILQQLATPNPKINFSLHVRPGSSNDFEAKAISAMTNEQGMANFELEAGSYCLVLDEKKDEPKAENYQAQFLQIDTECLPQWGQKCELSFTVNEDGSVTPADLELKLVKRCHLNTYSPCVIWDGPIPPSAPGPSRN